MKNASHCEDNTRTHLPVDSPAFNMLDLAEELMSASQLFKFNYAAHPIPPFPIRPPILMVSATRYLGVGSAKPIQKLILVMECN